MTKFFLQMEEFGIKSVKVHRNIPPQTLVEIATQKNEGIVTSTGSLSGHSKK